jgi:hypothetical protein
MDETRRLAAEYRRATGQTLPVSAEIAKFDAIRLLHLNPLTVTLSGVDALGSDKLPHQRIQIKGRVIFDEAKSGHRIGQLNLDGEWNVLVLVLMDEKYEPIEIYQMDRDTVKQVIESNDNKRGKRGAMSVAKFKALGRRVWSAVLGIENEEIWENKAP